MNFISWVIFVFIVLILSMWLLMHRLVSVNDQPLKITSKNLIYSKNIQRLIYQANQLFKEIRYSNLSISEETVESIEKLKTNHIFVEVSEKQKEEEIEHYKSNYAKCNLDKKLINEKLNHCKQVTSNGNEDRNHESIDKNVIKTTTNINKVENTDINTDSKWLIIAIPTISRLHNEDYLLVTLESIASQLSIDKSNIFYNQILICVVNTQIYNYDSNNEKNKHIVYENAKTKYTNPNYLKAIYFQFIELTVDDILPDPIKNKNEKNDFGNANKPGFLVRKQTRSLVSVIKKNINKANFYLFLEDDMKFCSNFIITTQYLLDKSSRYHPNWLAIRASYGMNGIFMHNKDLEFFSNYLLSNQARRPPGLFIYLY
jgi:hypothetical protein